MSTTAGPRFTRISRRGHELELADPLPSTLAALIAERSAQHRRVAERLQEFRTKQVELSRELTRQEEADRQAATQAALHGKRPARRQKAASLRRKLEEVEHELQGFENALARSADSLLPATQPLAGKAGSKAAEGKRAALGRAREHQAAQDAALEEADHFAAEEQWLALLASGPGRIEPFQPRGGDPLIAQLRRGLQDQWLTWEDKDERQQADLERQRRYEEENRETWERQRERAEEEDRAGRVRYEGMRLTHRGGQPVAPGPFHALEEEDEPEA
jgi:hypothetical protein